MTAAAAVPSRSRYSPAVRSGLARTTCRRRSASAASTGVGPGRAVRGATSPVSRRRCFSRRTQAALTDYSIVPYQSTHVQGGTVMGADPNTSVTNKYCQVWNMPNLFVIGASNFPQNAGYNPTGTVGALAYLAADQIASKYLSSPGMLG